MPIPKQEQCNYNNLYGNGKVSYLPVRKSQQNTMDDSAVFLVIDIKCYITMPGVTREYLNPLRSRHTSLFFHKLFLFSTEELCCRGIIRQNCGGLRVRELKTYMDNEPNAPRILVNIVARPSKI